MPENLNERLAAIKEVQAQKMAEAAKVNEAHGEALKENKLYETRPENVLREGLEILDKDIDSASKEVDDVKLVLEEARRMDMGLLLRDPGEILKDVESGDTVSKELDAIMKEAEQKISEFEKLKSRRRALKEEIDALSLSAEEDKKESTEAELEKKVESAKDIEELIAALQSVEFVTLSSGERAPAKDLIGAITKFGYMAPEGIRAMSKEGAERYLAGSGVTSRLGIRAKAMELIWPK